MSDENPLPAPGDDKDALDELVKRLYSQLKPLADRVRWRGTNPSLNPSALVNEAYLRLINSKGLAQKPHHEVIGIFAHVMRQILVDAARKRKSLKRGGGGVTPLTLPDLNNARPTLSEAISTEDLLALDASVDKLRMHDPLQADIIDRRFYLGLTAEETAGVLGLSKSKMEREERKAKEFLAKQLQP